MHPENVLLVAENIYRRAAGVGAQKTIEIFNDTDPCKPPSTALTLIIIIILRIPTTQLLSHY